MIDMTAEGTTDVMTRIAEDIEPYKPYWYEEPLDAFDVDAYRELKQKTNLTIATGERLFTRYGFRRLIETRAVDVVQPDPGTCGGILEGWRNRFDGGNVQHAHRTAQLWRPGAHGGGGSAFGLLIQLRDTGDLPIS